MKAIRFECHGGPEVLRYVDIDVPPPGPGEVRLTQRAVGLNYVDTYHRSGLYPMPLPSGLGSEGTGIVEELGPGVKGLKPGDRVAYGTGPLGAYAQVRNFPANRLVKLPKDISDETAAAMMLKGMTVRYLLRASYRVKRDETILLHAAAGGVGIILSQWASALGVKVIGTVGSDEKAAIALAHGCSFVINSSREDVAKRVRELTEGEGVPVVYDGVGQATIMASLDSLKPRGMLVNFGSASGPVKSFDLGLLAAKGSLYVTRPTLGTFVSSDADFRKTAADLVAMVVSGKVKIPLSINAMPCPTLQRHTAISSRAKRQA